MRRIALLSLTTLLTGCNHYPLLSAPFATGSNPNLPLTDSVNMSRVQGREVAVTPLKTEPGDIWPGPLPPPRSLQDLERQGGTGIPAAPARGSPLDRAGKSTLTAPLPGGAPGAAPGGGGAMLGAPEGDRRIIVPNGNGTSTVIHPDGRIETIPTPK